LPSLPDINRMKRYAPWVLGVLFLLFTISTILSFPPVHYLGDELGMLYRGSEFLDEVTSGDRVGYQTPRLFYAGIWAVTGLLGTGVVQARLMSVVFGFMVLWLVYLIGREVSGPRAGALAVLLLGSDMMFNWNLRLIRPEIMTSVFLYASFLFLIRLDGHPHGSRYAFFSGALIALSLNVHPNNLQYIVAFAVLYTVLEFKRIRSIQTLMFFGGMASVVCAWVLMVYVPEVVHSSGQSASEAVGSLHKSYPFPFLNRNILTLAFSSAGNFVKDYLIEYPSMANSLLPNRLSFFYTGFMLLACALAGAFTSARSRIALLILFPAGTLYLNYFLTSKFGYWHIVELHPFIWLAAAVGITAAAAQMKKEKVAVALPYVLLALVAVPGYFDTVQSAVVMRSSYDYGTLTKKVARAVPETGKVLAHVLHKPAFPGRHVELAYDVEKITPMNRRCPSLKSKVELAGASVVIFDEAIEGMMRTACGGVYVKESLMFLSGRGELHKLVQHQYPHYWATGRMLQNMYVIKMKEDNG